LHEGHTWSIHHQLNGGVVIHPTHRVNQLAQRVKVFDPYNGYREEKPFYEGDSIKNLISPYLALRGMSHFTLLGVPNELLDPFIAHVTSLPPGLTPSDLLAQIQSMKETGNDAYNRADYRHAAETYAQAMVFMIEQTRGPRADALFSCKEATDLGLPNELSELYFKLSSNRVLTYLSSLRFILANPASAFNDNARIEMPSFGGTMPANPSVQDEISTLYDSIILTHDASEAVVVLSRGSTWQPSDEQIAKSAYRAAVGCRLMATRKSVERGMLLIHEADRRMPDFGVIKGEILNMWDAWRQVAGPYQEVRV